MLLALVASGCATNLSTLQTARTLEPKQWRASAGLGVYVPAGQIGNALDLASDQAARLARAESGEEALPTPDEQREMFNTAAALAVYPPGGVMELGVRYGVVRNVDVGARWSSSSWRLDGRWRFLHDAEGTHVALGLGVEKHSYDGLVFDLYEKLKSLAELFNYIELEDPSRWDAEAQILASKDIGRFLQPYAAFKYRAAFYSLPSVLTVTPPSGAPLVQRQEIEGVAHFVGGSAGLAMGYRQLWVFFEMSAAWLMSDAEILGETTSLGGFTVYPALGIAARFP